MMAKTSATGMLLALALALAALPMTATAQPADPISGEWQGFYTCSQGLTAVTINLDRSGDGWAGIFAFGPHPGNPRVPVGSRETTLTLDGDAVRIVPGDWIQRPSGYTANVYEGTLSADFNTISGSVLSSTCTTFEVTRMVPHKAPQVPTTGKSKG